MRGDEQARRRSRTEWRRMWRSVPYADQKRIRAALRRGAAVDEPALAPLAVDAAEHRLRGDEGFGYSQYRGAISAVQAILAAALVAGAIADGDPLLLLFGVAMIALAAGELVVQRIERGRLRRAIEANRALAAQPRYPPKET